MMWGMVVSPARGRAEMSGLRGARARTAIEGEDAGGHQPRPPIFLVAVTRP